ncbi:hypothetical protein BY458DRAFT_586058 [Sporodiniella umbellata]|nr:hypothetical protein BY458DRAFT_586058 [Sporodiniella umbellata]
MYKNPYPTPNTRRRTHLKPSQVAVLQESFVVNALPDSNIRAQLAKKLDVTERTVQIWFQNRRAKARKSEASLEPNVRTGWIDVPVNKIKQKGSEQPPFQATFRTLVTPEYYEEASTPIKKRPRSSSKPEKFTGVQALPPPRAMSEGIHLGYQSDRLAQEKPSVSLVNEAFISVPVNTLRIGTWTRFTGLTSENQCSLICFGNSQQLVWQVQDAGYQFRVHVDYNQIKHIRLSLAQLDLGQLDIEIEGASSFTMRRSAVDQEWVPCDDFTEHKQASVENVHTLQGDHNQLKHCLLELIVQVPLLGSKLVMVPNDFLCRDVSISPSATPEPIYFDQQQWVDPKDTFSFLSQQPSPTFDQPNWLLDPLLSSENNFLNFI